MAGSSFKYFKESLRRLHSQKPLWAKLLLATGTTFVGVCAVASPVFASDLVAHPVPLPWPHDGIFSSHDHAALRRGYQVYKQVCSACHSMTYLSYRHLVGHIFTEKEAKAEAAEVMVTDGPNEEGHMFQRPGRLSDNVPSPYPNPEAARFANAGALPPDLTFITKARVGLENYVFHLLTGFHEPPPGKHIDSTQYYNPYMPGGAISMAPPLYNEAVEYEDGTPATLSQMSKDVSCFLAWSADMNHDTRKRVLSKAVIILLIGTVLAGIYKRKKWSSIKTRKVIYKNRPPPKDV